MSAGTIALTNNSATVTGTGTSFTTELKPGDFVYVTVGGAPYTLVASSVTSDTQLILAVAFDGPTTTGLAWNAVPASLQVAITQKILNDFAQVARGRILDFQNWQKIYSSDQSVTVTRPDRTTFTGPSWGYMAAQYQNALTKSDNLASLADKAAARKNLGWVYGALPVLLGGTGGTTQETARTGLGLGTSAVYDLIGAVANGNAIIESGSNSNGAYVKFADGTMICWSQNTAATVSSGAFGALYVGVVGTLIFPASFVGSVPRCAPAGRYGGSGSLAWAAVNSPTLTGVTMNVIGTNSASTCIADYIAIGRWKA